MGRRAGGPRFQRLIVYFHGSALVTLGLNSHRRFVSRLSATTGAKVFNVGYRLAPQASIEEAVADGVDGYRYVLSHGFDPDRIVLAGDSAGGLMAADVASRRGTPACRCRPGRR